MPVLLYSSGARWGRERLSDGPSERVETVVCGLDRQIEETAPLGERVHFAAPSNGPVGAGVIGLLLAIGPSDVAGFVMPVDIDSVDRVSGGWSRTDIAKKCGEIMLPRLAHSNPSIGVVARARATDGAPILDASPSHVFGRLGQSVCPRTGRCEFGSEAAATARAALAEPCASDERFIAAVAAAQPPLMFLAMRDNGQSSEALSGHVDECSHDPIVADVQEWILEENR